VTISGAARELLRQAQALLGHTVPSGDVAVIIERALEALVIRLEKQKFAKCDRPRPQRGPAKGRHIPAAVRRAVHERDGGQCTFVSENGKRCESRTRLEYDHVEPAARGGHATVSGIRLRCRAHNQYAAEMIYGEELMRARREARRDWAAKVQAERRNGNQEVVTSPA
jgi:5-methylcytosine-specific restriction endonuclease McrA